MEVKYKQNSKNPWYFFIIDRSFEGIVALIAGSWLHVSKLQYTKKIAPNKKGGGEYKSKCLTIMDLLIRDRPFNMKGGGYGFLFRSEFVFRTTQELFILSRKARIFFPEFNIRLYDKNSESDYFFFPPPKSEYFFQQHWESEYIFLEKNHNPPFPNMG